MNLLDFLSNHPYSTGTVLHDCEFSSVDKIEIHYPSTGEIKYVVMRNILTPEGNYVTLVADEFVLKLTQNDEHLIILDNTGNILNNIDINITEEQFFLKSCDIDYGDVSFSDVVLLRDIINAD